MKWTNEQEAAITARDCDLLVSAAAGSGKTAVLVERIIGRITDEKAPVDIDRILVVTFTKAAASEMKERLLKRIQEVLLDRPGDANLMRQLSLADHARVCTIDSFCNYVLRNYYNYLDMDPSFRVADESEMLLIRKKVFDHLMEKYFEEKDPDFLNFVDAFSTGRKLDGLYEEATKLYDFSQSMPWPAEWLDSCTGIYELDSLEALKESPLVKNSMENIHQTLEDALDTIHELQTVVDGASDIKSYRKSLDKDEALLKDLIACESLSDCHRRMQGEDVFPTIGSARGNSAEKAYVSLLRGQIKERIKKLDSTYFALTGEGILESIRLCRPYARILIRMTKDFLEAFMAAKTEKNILDFSDVEHLALRILIREHEGDTVISYSEVAEELAGLFEEIYIDEYQDSNLVQELILTSVSRERENAPNMFMVGDVKQSIYRFRQARPDIFNGKHRSYEDREGASHRKIELHQNFRSRRNILACVNDIFFRVMQPAVGDIAYTKEVQLNFGGEEREGSDPDCEVCLVSKFSTDEEKAATTLCAHAAALKIEEMLRENPGLKKSDIVILLRSLKDRGKIYADVLRSHRIEAVYTSNEGFYETPEIQDITNFLTVIDNPRQDIPLAGLMRSYFCYFTAEEMAQIKGSRRKTQYYQCLKDMAGQDGELGRKCAGFLKQLETYREMNRTGSICELLTELIYATGYFDYVGLLGSGALRKENLKRLIKQAETFEQGSMSGLFQFLRYIEKLKSYNVEMSEATVATEYEDAVRIMTIHKSKGLEFPVVILGDAHADYNLKDTDVKILKDATYGLTLDAIDPVHRTKSTPIFKKMMKEHLVRECIGEEIRVLYVALTRAVDRFIVIGCPTKKKAEEYPAQAICPMDSYYLLENHNFLDLITPVAMAAGNTGRFTVSVLSDEDLTEYIKASIYEKAFYFKEYIDRINEAPVPEAEDELIQTMEYSYPYVGAVTLRSKYSVSDLKMAAMEADDTLTSKVQEPELSKPIPYFMQTEEDTQAGTNAGTIYGNAYHKFFELLDYATCKDEATIAEHLQSLLASGHMSEEYVGKIRPQVFVHFLSTELGKRMCAAALRQELFREQPFIMSVKGSEVEEGASEDDQVLVQGIIDAFFFEGNRVILVDYKTDRVPEGDEGEEILVKRYRRQLLLYMEAIRKVTGKEIGGAYLYSTCLGKEISILP